MHHHLTPTRSAGWLSQVSGWIWFHRHQLAAAAALGPTIALLAFATPWLIALAAVERNQSRRAKQLVSLIVLASLVRAIAWLWDEFRRYPLVPHGGRHECEWCSSPISDASRARFCSAACRRCGRLALQASFDDRAAARLARLRQPASSYDPSTAEIPF
jgi:hypothetical protein